MGSESTGSPSPASSIPPGLLQASVCPNGVLAVIPPEGRMGTELIPGEQQERKVASWGDWSPLTDMAPRSAMS